VSKEYLCGEENFSPDFFHFFSIGLPISASNCTHIISLLHNNETLSYGTGFPKLVFSGDIGPKITVILFLLQFICVGCSLIDSIFAVENIK